MALRTSRRSAGSAGAEPVAVAALAIIGVTIISGCASTAPAGLERSRAAEDEIWAFERAYWEHNRSADTDEIASAWHEEFLGWPQGEPRPAGKEEARAFARRTYTVPDAFDFELEPAGIRILGDVAIVHYAVHLTSKEGRPSRAPDAPETGVREPGPDATPQPRRAPAAPAPSVDPSASAGPDDSGRPAGGPRDDVGAGEETRSKDGQGPESRTTLRITHTLVREGGAWKILGGMSSRG